MQFFLFFYVSTLFVFIQNFDFPIDVCKESNKTGNVGPCLGTLAWNIWKVHQWSSETPVNICGMSCFGSVKGRISRLEWKWDGRFRCPWKLPGIEGRDTKKSRNGAIEWAIKNFLSKAIESGKLNIDDLHC